MRDWTGIIGGALGGAALSLAIVFAASGFGFLPAPAGGISGQQIRAYLLANPGLISEMSDKYQAEQQAEQDKASAAAVKKIGMAAFFDPKIAFVSGPADAKKSLVEFYDYNCPYCRASLPAVEKYYNEHKNDTRFSFIEFPIKGPESTVAAKVALAARNQPDKYLKLHFLLMGEQELVNQQVLMADAAKAGLDMKQLLADMEKPEILAAIDASHDLAKRAGIDGTPTFIINGVVRPGQVDGELLAEAMKSG
jgi:protein-disulfide isomerase